MRLSKTVFMTGALSLLSGCDLANIMTIYDYGAPDNGSSCAAKNTHSVDSISQGPSGLNPCAIIDGNVKCWGENTSGQLALGDLNNRGDNAGEMGSCLNAVDLGSGSTVVAVAENNGGARCALLSDGRVKCWGINYGGGLGLGDVADRTDRNSLGNALSAVNLGSGAVATAIAAGNSKFCALLSDGSVKCWGRLSGNTYYSGNPAFVGDSPSDMGDNLAAVSLPSGTIATKIAASGTGPTCAVLNDGSVYCWNQSCIPTSGNYTGPTFSCSWMTAGSQIPLGQISVGGTAKDIVLGSQFACALLNNGQVRCWGGNDWGQLGQGDTTARATSSAQIGDIPNIPAVDLGTGRTAKSLSAGSKSVCAILDNNSLKCWGYNSDAELGLEDTVSRGISAGQMGDNLPAVNLGSGRTAILVSGGVAQTCALLDDHSVKCWGMNVDGRLGQGNKKGYGGSTGTMGDALPAIQL